MVGDFNGDGIADLATNTDIGIFVLMGRGDGTFQAGVTSGYHAISLAVVDLNGDGRVDLATDNVSVLLGQGDGTFQSSGYYAAGSSPFNVAVGDLNSDGRADLAVANYDSGDVTVLLNTTVFNVEVITANLLGGKEGVPFSAMLAAIGGIAPYSWSATGLPAGLSLSSDGSISGTPTAVGVYTVEVTVSDSSGQNASKILTLTIYPTLVSFQAGVNYNTGFGPVSVAVGDLNEDGIADLAVANTSSHNVSILLGLGGGAFQAGMNYDTGSNPNRTETLSLPVLATARSVFIPDWGELRSRGWSLQRGGGRLEGRWYSGPGRGQ